MFRRLMARFRRRRPAGSSATQRDGRLISESVYGEMMARHESHPDKYPRQFDSTGPPSHTVGGPTMSTYLYSSQMSRSPPWPLQ